MTLRQQNKNWNQGRGLNQKPETIYIPGLRENKGKIFLNPPTDPAKVEMKSEKI
jgi:hypothetical protein